MTEADAKAAEPQSGGQARVRELERVASELREHIERERASLPQSAEELQAAVRQAQEAVEGVQRRIDAAKAEARALKDEIDELERRHAEVPEAARIVEWPRLVGEKVRRLAEVGVREGLIASLEGEKLAAAGALEAARQRLAAFEAGVYDRPVEEDPRLVSLREEISAALEASKPRDGVGKKKKAAKRAARKKEKRAKG